MGGGRWNKDKFINCNFQTQTNLQMVSLKMYVNGPKT